MKLTCYFSHALIIILAFVFVACGNSETTTEATKTTAETLDTNEEAPTKFASIEEMVNDLGDYSTEDNTFEQLEGNKVRISPSVSESADEAETRQIVQTSLVTLAMRTFIHTNLDNVTIKVVPRKVSLDPTNAELMNDYAVEVNVSREKAKEVAKTHAGVELNQLVGNKIGDLFRADMLNPNMEKLIAPDKLETVYNQLTGAGAQ